MHLFTRKSKWDRLMDAAAAALADARPRRLARITLGVMGGAVAATAASAAISAARRKDEQ
jgi:hypothetical protein